MSKHNDTIVDQFTRQAEPFARKPEHSDDESNRILLAAMKLEPVDRVLDVACGPGLTACLFAPHVKHVIGIDLTPAMLDQARKRAIEKKLTNLTWRQGDVTALPFNDGTFSVVFSRYAFHHFTNPHQVLAEMARVCAPGGKIIVADVYTESDAQQQAYDRIEKLRDPSHASALRIEHLRQLYDGAGLTRIDEQKYRLEMDLDALLAASFPNPGDADRVKQLMSDDIDKNLAGFQPHRDGDAIRFSFPVVIMVGRCNPRTSAARLI